MVSALFVPFAGVGRASGVIAYWSADLSKAHKAEALYTLAKVTRDAAGEVRAESKHINRALFWYLFLRT